MHTKLIDMGVQEANVDCVQACASHQTRGARPVVEYTFAQ